RRSSDSHRAGHGEGHAQDARLRRPEAARRPGAGRAGLRRARGGEALAVEEIAAVYARSLFEVAKEQGKLDEVREQLGQFADAMQADRDLQVFFFSPYFSTP